MELEIVNDDINHEMRNMINSQVHQFYSEFQKLNIVKDLDILDMQMEVPAIVGTNYKYFSSHLKAL